jgi:tRNA(His) 5'-end guanylyltransferase
MVGQTLQERLVEYESCFDLKFTKRLPLIIKIEGKNFTKVTRRLSRPFDTGLIDLFAKTISSLVKQIDGVVIAYQYSDEVVLVIRNDQNKNTDAWLNNRQHDVVSMIASIMTHEFNDALYDLEDPLDLSFPIFFSVRGFVVPNITESINVLIERQQTCIRNSISTAIYSELLKHYPRKQVQDILKGKSIEKRFSLFDDFGIDYEKVFPIDFRRGIACYRVPTIIECSEEQITKDKWRVDRNLPLFSESHDFLFGIISTGRDVFRSDRDL